METSPSSRKHRAVVARSRPCAARQKRTPSLCRGTRGQQPARHALLVAPSNQSQSYAHPQDHWSQIAKLFAESELPKKNPRATGKDHLPRRTGSYYVLRATRIACAPRSRASSWGTRDPRLTSPCGQDRTRSPGQFSRAAARAQQRETSTPTGWRIFDQVLPPASTKSKSTIRAARTAPAPTRGLQDPAGSSRLSQRVDRSSCAVVLSAATS